MIEVTLDVETKKAFSDVGGHNFAKLGVSFVGICERKVDGEKVISDEFVGFFEDDLSKLWPILEKADRIIGFNIIGFDFPVMQPYYHGDLSLLPVLDILDEIKKVVGHRVSLDAIAQETLGTQKSGSGLDAIRYFEEGKLNELAKYCLDDVRITRDVYLYGQKHGFVKFVNKWNRMIEAAVDFSFKDEGEWVRGTDVFGGVN